MRSQQVKSVAMSSLGFAKLDHIASDTGGTVLSPLGWFFVFVSVIVLLIIWVVRHSLPSSKREQERPPQPDPGQEEDVQLHSPDDIQPPEEPQPGGCDGVTNLTDTMNEYMRGHTNCPELVRPPKDPVSASKRSKLRKIRTIHMNAAEGMDVRNYTAFTNLGKKALRRQRITAPLTTHLLVDPKNCDPNGIAQELVGISIAKMGVQINMEKKEDQQTPMQIFSNEYVGLKFKCENTDSAPQYVPWHFFDPKCKNEEERRQALEKFKSDKILVSFTGTPN